MIRTFVNKGLQRFAERGDASKLSVQNTARVERILRQLDIAVAPDEMNLPGWRFHRLSGDRSGRYSVVVSGNWRITFGLDGQDAMEVDLEDYH